jgi:hypothetical protein
MFQEYKWDLNKLWYIHNSVQSVFVPSTETRFKNINYIKERNENSPFAHEEAEDYDVD